MYSGSLPIFWSHIFVLFKIIWNIEETYNFIELIPTDIGLNNINQFFVFGQLLDKIKSTHVILNVPIEQ